jgi:hypothetical protein
VRSARRERLRRLREQLAERDEPLVITVRRFGPPEPAPEAPERADATQVDTSASEVTPENARWHRCGACGSLVLCAREVRDTAR